MLREIDHFIGGESYSSGDRSGDVFDPNQGQVQAKVRLGTAADLERAMDAAKAAQPAWAATNPQRRARVMFKFKDLVETHMDELAHMLSSEHGKVIADAMGPKLFAPSLAADAPARAQVRQTIEGTNSQGIIGTLKDYF